MSDVLKTKKKIIILDDSEYKREHIREYMEELYPDAEIEEFSIRNTAIAYLRENREDLECFYEKYLIVLDMGFPILSDMPPKPDEGVHFLYFLKRGKFAVDVIVCSSEDTYKEKCTDVDYKYLLGFITFNSSVMQRPLFEEMLRKKEVQ